MRASTALSVGGGQLLVAHSPPQKSARTHSSQPCTNVVNQGGIQTILTATMWELEPTAVAASFGDAACSTPSQRVHKEAHVARFNNVETEPRLFRTGEARSAGRKSICQSSRAARESRREVLGERTLLGEGRSSSGARGRCSVEATCRGGSEWTRKFRFQSCFRRAQ